MLVHWLIKPVDSMHIALLPDKSGFQATGVGNLEHIAVYRHIAPLERKAILLPRFLSVFVSLR